MRPRIAIPVPHSRNPGYVTRALPQYERAVEAAGGEAVRIPLDGKPEEVKELIESCDGALLPGSPADVDPAQYNATRHPRTAAADAGRDALDQQLLDDAFRKRKPVFGICYGQQRLNVYCRGSLIQHIESPVKHDVGKEEVAHTVEVTPGSRLAKILLEAGADLARMPVNSSHHQSVDAPGEGLRIVSRCAEDNIVEAIEGTSADHFVLAVQWHPERSVKGDGASRALFRALVEAARAKHRELASKSAGG